MRKHLSRLIIVTALIVLGARPAQAQTPSTAEYERTKAATLEALEACKDKMKQAYGSFMRGKLNPVERNEKYMAALREAKVKSNIDKDFIRCLEIEEQILDEYQPYYEKMLREFKEMQENANFQENLGDAAVKSTDEPLEKLFFGLVFKGMSLSQQVDFQEKWKKILAKVQADTVRKYGAERQQVRKYLSEKYGYSFF